MTVSPSEKNLSDIIRYHKEPSETSSTIDEVEAWAEANGIIDLDNPDVKKQTILDDLSDFERKRYDEQKEREEREAIAQENYQKALGNLETGTADHRIKHERSKPAKSSTVKLPKSRKPALKPKKLKAKKTSSLKSNRNKIAQARREDIADKLRAGERIALKSYTAPGGAKAYQIQQSDIKMIGINYGINNIVRVASIKTGESYFVIDNYERYETQQVISSRLVHRKNHDLLKAVCSCQLVLACDLRESNKNSARAMTVLARDYDFNIHTVLFRNKLLGWVLHEEKDESFDEIKERQGLLLEAAYERFKSVAQDFDTTIAEILAIKDGQ